MARKAVSFEQVQEAFTQAQSHLPEGVALMTVSGDDTKCVLMAGGACATYSNSTLKGHLEFLATLA